jgi:hypothetical protein
MVLLVPVKFSNLDFGPCKKNYTQFAPVKFKPIDFSPSFDLSAKKTIMWHGFSDMADAMLDSCDTLAIFLFGEKKKMPRDQNQNSRILQGLKSKFRNFTRTKIKIKIVIFFLFFFFHRIRTEKLPSSTIF